MSKPVRLKLSEDAKAATSLFRHNPGVEVRFRTPSRIHPRMAKALEELVEVGVLRHSVEDGGHYVFTVRDREKLIAAPKLSEKALIKNSLPLTVD